MRDSDTAASVIEYFECLLKASSVKTRSGQLPIVFNVAGETWLFDPHSRGRLLKRQDNADAPLRLTCAPETLRGILTTPGYRPAPYEITFEGDLDALLPLADALQRAHTPLSLRALKGKLP